jgi:L-asparaginase II
MRAHPFFVAGTGRVCTTLMETAPGVVAKVGAEGLGCVLLPSGDAAAFKVRDGSARAREALVAGVAALLGALPSPPPPAIEPFLRPAVTGGGRRVGELRVRGALARP